MKKIARESDDESHTQNNINQSENLNISSEISALQRSVALLRRDLPKIIDDELIRFFKDRS